MNTETNVSVSDLEARLSDELHAAAEEIPTGGGDPNRAIARADQRRQRRSMAVAAAGVAVVGGLSVASLALRPTSQTAVVAAAGDDGDPTTANAPLTLEWRTTDADVGWPVASFVGDDGLRYALSTAPGTRFSDADGPESTPVPQAIYRSVDGENWEAIEQDGPRLGTLTSRDGVLYSVSTSTDASGATVGQVVRSDDGATWSSVDVALDFDEVVDPNDVLLTPGAPWLTLTAGDGQLIVSATRSLWFDDQALAAHLGVAAENVYAEVVSDDSGEPRVVVRDYTECAAAAEAIESAPDEVAPTTLPLSDTSEACDSPPIVADVSLADLGISGELTQQRAAISTDGVSWTPTDVPGSQIWFAGGVFIAADFQRNGGAVFSRSADGVNWTPMSIGTADSIDIVGTSNNLLVGRSYQSDWSVEKLTISGDGGESWRDVDITEMDPTADGSSHVASIAAGDLGIVAVIGKNSDDPDRPLQWTVVTSTDGSTWTTQSVADIGDIGRGYPSWAFVDADHLGVVFEGARRNDDGSIAAVTVLGTPTR